MKKLALLASLAALAMGYAPSAMACQEDSLAALRCNWTFHGEYVVKNFEATNEYVGGPSRGYSCLAALEELTNECSSNPYKIKESVGNALTDTYLLKQACISNCQ